MSDEFPGPGNEMLNRPNPLNFKKSRREKWRMVHYQDASQGSKLQLLVSKTLARHCEEAFGRMRRRPTLRSRVLRDERRLEQSGLKITALAGLRT